MQVILFPSGFLIFSPSDKSTQGSFLDLGAALCMEVREKHPLGSAHQLPEAPLSSGHDTHNAAKNSQVTWVGDKITPV